MTKDSRYRALRGKSVSEPRRELDRSLGDDMESTPLSPSRDNTPDWRKRPKTREHMEPASASTDDLHSPFISVPPLPHPQKEHAITTRPKAAIMPPRPEFGRPSVPTPLGMRKSGQPSILVASSADDIAFSDKIAAVGDDSQRKELDTVPEREVEMVHEEEQQPTEHKDSLHQHDRQDPPASPVSQSEAETDRMLAEQKRLLHQHLMSTELAAESMHSLASTFTFATRTPPKSPILSKLGFFARGRSSRATFSPAPSTIASTDSNRTQSSEPLLSSRASMAYNQQLMTPPISPISTCDREFASHVCVRYRGEYTNISITDTTDTVDVLCQASKSMNSPINTSASIVFECYSSLGLERRLRRYERIDKVMASWSQNTKNLLVIRHAKTPNDDKDLDFASVPRTPLGFMLQLHHCSRPGKWQQRWITLLQDGHMIASKKPASSFLEKDCQRLCHLSVCDIYTAINDESTTFLDHRQSRSPRHSPIKSLKPPKKYVLAIKSQHQPATKYEADNYVHYFCTEDPAVAGRFHDMVHAWRSWYMVKVHKQSPPAPPLMNVREAEPAPQITPVRHKPAKSISYAKVSSNHKVKISRDDTPYTIGELGDKPLIDMERFEKPLEEYGKDWIKIQRHSGGSPMTPGTTDSGVSMTTPLTGEPVDGIDSFDCASPSAERRKRLDTKRSLGAPILTTEGSADVTISITEPPPEEVQTPPPPPKLEIRPWLPSASEHTAKLRADQARQSPPIAPPRPATSSGLMGRTSLQPPSDTRRRRHNNHKTHPSLPPQQVALWREASKWADSRTSQNLEPSSGASTSQRLLAARPSMPALGSSSPAAKRVPPSANCPAIWREPPTTRPSTSGGERTSRLSRGRSTSGASIRRGSGAPHGDVPPPLPNMPAHLRSGARDVNMRAAAGLSAPTMLSGSRGWVARPSN